MRYELRVMRGRFNVHDLGLRFPPAVKFVDFHIIHYINFVPQAQVPPFLRLAEADSVYRKRTGAFKPQFYVLAVHSHITDIDDSDRPAHEFRLDVALAVRLESLYRFSQIIVNRAKIKFGVDLYLRP